jgi:enamine deaminase RidA (YjgF/YER057c/UK114 family)
VITLLPAGWPRPKGYAAGVAASGTLVFVSGQIGWDERETVVSQRLSEQVRQALRNVVAILAEAGAKPEHIVRLTWYVTDRDEYVAARADIGAAYREVVGRHYPAMAVVEVSRLVEPAAKVEIEATAVVPA